MPQGVNVLTDSMQVMLYLLRKRHLGAGKTAWLKASEGLIQGAPFARICVEAEALKAFHILS